MRGARTTEDVVAHVLARAKRFARNGRAGCAISVSVTALEARIRWLVVAALAPLGCGHSTSPPPDLAIAADLATPAICSDPVAPDGGIAPTFTNVQRVFDNQCTVCHCCNGEVNLSAGQSYAALVKQLSPDPVDACGGVLVQPGNAAASYLYVKISSATPCAGARMPRGEFASVPLPDCQIDLIKRWIDSGAPND